MDRSTLRLKRRQYLVAGVVALAGCSTEENTENTDSIGGYGSPTNDSGFEIDDEPEIDDTPDNDTPDNETEQPETPAENNTTPDENSTENESTDDTSAIGGGNSVNGGGGSNPPAYGKGYGNEPYSNPT